MSYTSVDLFPDEAEKKIGDTPEFYAGQKVTAEDMNKWFSLLITQGDFNSDWLQLLATQAQAAINQALTDILHLTEIAVPGSGTTLANRIAAIEIATATMQTALTLAQTNITTLQGNITTLQNALTTKVNITDPNAIAGTVYSYKNIGGSL